MQRFQYSYLLHLLWLLIPLVALIVWYLKWKTKKFDQIFSSLITTKILPNKSILNERLKYGLFLLSLVFLIIAIANPQIGLKGEKMKGQGIDIMVLLDVSNSMLAEDIQPNRINRSKLFVSKLLDNLKQDRVGLILFAGSSYLQVPLTIDFTSIKMSLPIIDPSSFPSQGTNISEAVAMAGETLGLTESKSKAIVIITDGEDHDEDANAAIENARNNGIRVFAIGVGEEEGAPIPISPGHNKRDEDGNIVKTAFNRKMLENLASIGTGSFYHLGKQGSIVEDVVAELNKLEGKDFEDFDYSNFNSYFYWFALVALIMLALEFMLPSIKMEKFFKAISCIGIFVVLSTPNIYGQSNEKNENKSRSRTYIRKGNSNYQNNNFKKAELNYRKALSANPKSRTSNFNLGNALYNQDKFGEAAEFYENSINKNLTKISKARSYHNLGNAHFKENRLDDAIAAYENALKLNPSDMDTKFNLTLAKKKKDSKGGGKNNKKQNKSQKDKKEGDQDKKDKNNEGQGGAKKEKQESKPQKSSKGMTKQEAKRLLDALKNQEQKTQNKLEKRKKKPEGRENVKDW